MKTNDQNHVGLEHNCSELADILSNLTPPLDCGYLEIDRVFSKEFNYMPIFKMDDKKITELAFRDLSQIDKLCIVKSYCELITRKDLTDYILNCIKENPEFRLYNPKKYNRNELNFYKLSDKRTIVLNPHFFLPLFQIIDESKK